MDCQVIPFEETDGPSNMALDEAMLDAVAADPRAALLRSYGWSVPTLSLGYFQSMAAVEADPRWQAVAVVRRPTGGGALWHHHELTYALAIPKAHPLARRSGDLYRTVHSALCDLLRVQGVAAERRGRGTSRENRPFLCFTDRDSEDIVAAGVKLVGSAQRRRSGAVLQHGAVLLARSPVTPELPGASDLAPITTDVKTWSNLLSPQITAALGFRIRTEPLANSLRARAAALAESVYRNDAWTRRR